jgi:hypothetical protein
LRRATSSSACAGNTAAAHSKADAKRGLANDFMAMILPARANANITDERTQLEFGSLNDGRMGV